MSITGILQFTKPSYTITEDGVYVGDAIAVSRTGGSSGIASVKVTSKNLSAVAGQDYTRVSVTLTWANGEGGSKLVPLSVIKDAFVENEEILTLTLSSIKGAKYAPVKTVQVKIIDKVQNLLSTPTNDTIIALISNEYSGLKLGDLKTFIGAVTPNPNPDPNPDPNPNPNPEPNSDPYLNNVALLLKSNGNNGSTNIVDTSSFNHVIINPNNGVINKPNYLEFAGPGNYLALDSDFLSNFGPFAGNKKTIECLIEVTDSLTGVAGIIGNYKGVAVNGRWRMAYSALDLSMPNPTMALHFGWTTSPSTDVEVVFTQPYINGFNHLAVCVDSTIPELTTIYLCINGVTKIFVNNDFTSQTTLFNANVIGWGLDGINGMKAHINALRLTKNVRYTANFNPMADTYL